MIEAASLPMIERTVRNPSRAPFGNPSASLGTWLRAGSEQADPERHMGNKS
ncbi:MAG: hypothetical protein O7A06_10160 [Acidobacteria bacterium]|nr:hypothetical protein [Acidobacteriota bacterium]MCZ6750698.1 hypothetical protein [Acidobacteriota bacterium]